MRTLIQALKTKELRNKILFTLGIIIIYRIGSFIPTPGVDYKVVQQCVGSMNSTSENFIGLVNLFSGGAMLQLSIFALGVMRTSRHLSSSSCSAWSFPALRRCIRKASLVKPS